MKIKPNGVAYRMGGTVHTATRLALELLAQYETYSAFSRADEQIVGSAADCPIATEAPTPDEIVQALRRITAERAAGVSLEAACSQLGISEATFCQWHAEYSGLDIRFAAKLTLLQKENTELRQRVAELTDLQQATRPRKQARSSIGIALVPQNENRAVRPRLSPIARR